jgi:hypothetical protein
LDLVSLKCLYSIGECPSPIFFDDGGLIKPWVEVKSGISHGNRMIIPQVLGQVSDRGIMSAPDSPVGSSLAIVAFSAALAACGSLQRHFVVSPGVRDIVIPGLVDHGIHRDRPIVTRQTRQGNSIRSVRDPRIKIRAGIHLVFGGIRQLPIPHGSG